jgi:GT2 family glycosyltransferase/glycosyltransferase involved in cell wall biosynthesis
MSPEMTSAPVVSIIIPIFNKLEFTRQCLERIARHTSRRDYEVIVVDNGSTDGSQEFFADVASLPCPVVYHRSATNLGYAAGNNLGARLSSAQYLLFLNNDTIAQPNWLEAMVALAESDRRIGIVGIKQLFPYTNLIHHTGIIFTAAKQPVHLYPHTVASLPHVNKQREYQAVTGACLLIPRTLFLECGLFDEGYVNGYEDIDLCLTVRERGRSVVCCTSAFIYHYGQISETRTDNDVANEAHFRAKWGGKLVADEAAFFQADKTEVARTASPGDARPSPRHLPQDAVYFAEDLAQPSALTWVSVDLALALDELGVPVRIRHTGLPGSMPRETRRRLEQLMIPGEPVGGTQICWSHYWSKHLSSELSGRVNLEFFVINYQFAQPGTQPWDYWLQCLPHNHRLKLPLSGFCRDVLGQIGVTAEQCHICRPGYSPEIDRVEAKRRGNGSVRVLSVTNSHDLERYGTKVLLETYWRTFSKKDNVVLVLKDYGIGAADRSISELLQRQRDAAPVEYIHEFTSKEKLIELYKSCDAFVSSHRGEGYGMKVLDALAAGLPAITPLFGGPADFCTAQNCFPVDYRLTAMGDCLDSRSLRITNGPTWAEPDSESLARQLRLVVEDLPSARRSSERARQDVASLTWPNAARALSEFIKCAQSAASAKIRGTRVSFGAPSAERSPYWLGRRISVVIPTYNRRESLLKCLDCLERQSILSNEFEVVVVDDGSSDGTAEALRSRRFRFELKYVFQENRGPGLARNAGIAHAEGELILFIGDDILADQHLLEEHLLAHAGHPDAGDAILGHIDWPAGMERTRVMDFVCGESTLQFAYHFIPKLKELDYRFFYTSNISLKRKFLVDAADDGVRFDQCFTRAAFEDSELAYRLQKRGLNIHYRNSALAYHDHWMDVEGFCRREYGAGQMAVVFYRKHPGLDPQLEVRWLADWSDVVDQTFANPRLRDHLRALDEQTDVFLKSLVKMLEEMVELQRVTHDDELSRTASKREDSLLAMLNGILGVIFDVERTRGKVEAWFGAVEDQGRKETAKSLLACRRKLERMSVHPEDLQKLQGTINWLNTDVVGSLRRQIVDLENQLGGRLSTPARRRVMRLARRADLFVQNGLGNLNDAKWLQHYQGLRSRLRDLARSAVRM